MEKQNAGREGSADCRVLRLTALSSWGVGLFVAAVLSPLLTFPASADLLGNYGVLSDFGCRPDTESRAVVRTMADSFGVREFQFYDWFADYSTPTSGTTWVDPFKRKREICLSTIVTFIDEIHRRGGRAWAYVQAVGAEEDDLADDRKGIYRLIDSKGAWHRHEGRFPTYFLNEAWARRMAAIWAGPVSRIGFDGIHWDSLGPVAGDYGAESAGTGEFLRTARAALVEFGLRQTFNFVDLAWWDADLVTGGIVEFPYAEVWSRTKATRYYEIMDGREAGDGRGVIAFYPKIDAPPGKNEAHVFLSRWTESRRHRLSYLLICNGARRVTGPYYPNTTPLSAKDRVRLRQE